MKQDIGEIEGGCGGEKERRGRRKR